MIRTAAAVLFLAMTGTAFAADPLTADQVTRFVATLAPVDALADRLDTEGKLDGLVDKRGPRAGEDFKPYSTGVAALKKTQPAEYPKLTAILKPHGFTADQWSAVGDRVMIAYMALKMDAENPGAAAGMEGMDPAMLAQMPPEVRAQMAGMMAMMETVKKAPAADKAAVKPSMKVIETELAKQDEQ